MGLISIGINHKTASVQLREKLAFTAENLSDALQSLSTQTQSGAAVIVSTCNRTELYTHAAQKQQLVQWLHQYHSLNLDELSRCLYCHEGEAVVQHLMRVSCGLDSQIIGEPQILGQIKQAFKRAHEAQTVTSVLDRLFQQVFSVAKEVRTQTAIGELSVSVAYAAVDLAKSIFGALDQSRVLLVGAGETIELVARYLHERDVQSLMIANRTRERAQTLADAFDAKAFTLSQVPEVLSTVDIVVSSTASTLPLLGKGLVEQSMIKRRHRPMLLIDLAVPRDIESEVAEIDGAFLYTVDDLQGLVQDHLDAREQAAIEADVITAKRARHFMDWYRAQESIVYVLRYRQQAEAMRQAAVEKALQELAQGSATQAVLEKMAHLLTNKLIHAPTVALTQASQRADYEELRRLRGILDIKLEKDR
jgi:glutamyl-tRNA reductase